MNRRFPVLSTIAIVLTCIGWIVFGLGAIHASVVVIGYFAKNGLAMGFSAIFSITLISSGVFLIALGESIRVMFAIEQNTRASSEVLTEMRDNMRADFERSRAKTPAKR